MEFVRRLSWSLLGVMELGGIMKLVRRYPGVS